MVVLIRTIQKRGNHKLKNIIKKCKYRLSFGGSTLRHKEVEYLINSYFKHKDWSKVIDEAVNNNIFQFKSTSSTKRVAGELCIRLRNLNSDEMECYLETNQFDQNTICWISVCRTYQFIRDFTIQVVLESYNSPRKELSHADFEFFFEEQAQWHSELNKSTHITKRTLRNVLFRMMREVGFLTPFNQLQPIIRPESFYDFNTILQQEMESYVPGVLL